jgi:hypothetical protein
MEEIAENGQVVHASFWQRQLALGIGKEFILRVRLPAGAGYVQALLDALAANEDVLVKESALLLGRQIV